MPSVGTLGGPLPWGPNRLKVECQAFPQDCLTGLKHPLQSACLSQITGVKPRVKLDVAGRSQNFLVDTGATYSILTSYSGVFSPQTCTILSATGKTIMKRFTRALLCCWDGQIFFHQFLVFPECSTPLLGKKNLSLLLKSCSYYSPDRRCFRMLFWGQTNYFNQPPRETAPEWERPFMNV